MKKIIGKEKKVVFIDLDSTLIRPVTKGVFSSRIINMTPIWQTWKALKEWSKDRSDLYVLIVSNQGGIELGRGSKECFLQAKFEFIKNALLEYCGPGITADYLYCPYNTPCHDRKPETGMFETFCSKYGLTDKSEMVMIGDASPGKHSFSTSDYDAACNFGIDYIDVDEL